MENKAENGVRGKESLSAEVMIFGDSVCAQRIAANLVDNGIGVCLAAGNGSSPASIIQDRVQWLSDTRLNHCHGFAGNFTLQIDHGHNQLKKTVQAIVVAEDDSRSPNYSQYRLTPGLRVVGLSDLEEKLKHSMTESFSGTDTRIVLLCGWRKDAHPSVARRMLEGCLQLQAQPGVSTYFMTGNMKVASAGSEELVHKAKQAGTVFFKFTGVFPTIQPQENGYFTIDYPDESTRNTFQLTADWVVVDETIEPANHLELLIQKLGIDQDHIGFAQSDNVRRLSNFTNRRGIFVAGGSRGVLSHAEQLADADQVSLNVLSFLGDLDGEPLAGVTIKQGLCARCLTCVRLCPHRAIEVGSRITVITEACQSCGICTAGCPGRAIEMEGVHIGLETIQRMNHLLAITFVEKPRIVVFGCMRSAGQSHTLIQVSGQALPEGVGFVEIPCGGTIAGRHLLGAFEAGADGVMLCICHTDNCQSEIGNVVARKRAESTRDLLASAGVETERLRIVSLSANMGNEFVYRIKAFIKDIVLLNNPQKENKNG